MQSYTKNILTFIFTSFLPFLSRGTAFHCNTNNVMDMKSQTHIRDKGHQTRRQNRTQEMRTQISLFRASLRPPALLSGQIRVTTCKECQNKSSTQVNEIILKFNAQLPNCQSKMIRIYFIHVLTTLHWAQYSTHLSLNFE